MGRKSYSDEENQRIIQMRKSGMPFNQIANELGRGQKAVWSHWYKMQNKTIKVKHRQKKGDKVVDMVAKQNVEAAKSRPMLAIVGDRAEVAQTIRELFS